MRSPRRLCRTADDRIVEADDPASAFLIVGVGGTVPREWRERVAAYLDVPAEADPEPVEPTVVFGTAAPDPEPEPEAEPEPEPEPAEQPKPKRGRRKPV